MRKKNRLLQLNTFSERFYTFANERVNFTEDVNVFLGCILYVYRKGLGKRCNRKYHPRRDITFKTKEPGKRYVTTFKKPCYENCYLPRGGFTRIIICITRGARDVRCLAWCFVYEFFFRISCENRMYISA